MGSGRKVPVAVGDAAAEPQPRADEKLDSGGLEPVLHGAPPPSPPVGMGRLERSRGRPFPWGWVIGSLTVLSLAAVGGFFVFNRTNQFSGASVQLELEAPAEVASGDDIVLTAKYQNLEPVNLVRAELTIEYPEGFTVQETSRASTNDFQNAFDLGTIASGRVATMTIKGTIFGSVNTARAFSATLAYRPANFNSEFQTTAEAKTKITSSILTLTLDGPKKLAPGASGAWTIGYANTANRDLANVQIEAVYPDGLEVTGTNPATGPESRTGTGVWRLDSIAQDTKGTITVTGSMVGDVGDTFELTARAGLVTATNTIDLQAEQAILVILVNTGLTTSVAVNGQTELSVAELGTSLNYTIRIANESDVEISDIAATVTLDGAALDLTELENPAKAKVDNRSLTWTKDQVLGLELLKPGQDVTIRLAVGTVASLTVDSDDDVNQRVVARVAVSSPTLPTPAEGTPPIEFTTKIVTTFGFQAEARYYSDEGSAYGQGPVPPVVGQTTSYRIFWRVTNTTSEAANMVVTAALPTHVFWTGKNIGRDAGDIRIDPDERTVSWTLNKVPPGTGSRLPTLVAYFEVSITPNDTQVGNSVVLTNTAAAKATDSFSGRTLEVSQPSLTTDVPNDPQAAGEGTVAAAEE